MIFLSRFEGIERKVVCRLIKGLINEEISV